MAAMKDDDAIRQEVAEIGRMVRLIAKRLDRIEEKIAHPPIVLNCAPGSPADGRTTESAKIALVREAQQDQTISDERFRNLTVPSLLWTTPTVADVEWGRREAEKVVRREIK